MAKAGDRLKFFEHEYIVKTKLASTGMGFDNSVFLSFQDARLMAERARKVTGLDMPESENLISNVLIKTKNIRPRDLSM